MTAPEATPASRRRLVRVGAAGLGVLAVVAGVLALRPEQELRPDATNAPAPPATATAPTTAP